RWAMGPPINRDFRVDVSRTGNVAHVTVEDIQDGRFSDLQPLTLTVTAPGGGTSQADLRQVAAGRYAATIVADSPGAYELPGSEPNLPRQPGRSESNGFVVPPVAETVSFTANDQSMRRIASETGGSFLDQKPGDLYQGPRAASVSRWDPIWAA